MAPQQERLRRRRTLPVSWHPPAAHAPRPPAPPGLQLVSGQAEVFGTALDLGERVTIGGQKVAVFTWEGCTLQLEGEPDMM